MVDQIARAKYKGNSWSAWNDVTPRHRALLDAILHSSMHVIVTLRSKTETAQTEENGRKKVVKLGMKAEQRDGFEYEMTVVLDLIHDGNFATATKDRTGLFSNASPAPITVDTGSAAQGVAGDRRRAAEGRAPDRSAGCRRRGTGRGMWRRGGAHPEGRQGRAPGRHRATPPAGRHRLDPLEGASRPRSAGMIDLTAIDSETIIARGQYATVRSAHEDEKKHLSILCGQLSSASSQVLRHMQPGDGAAPNLCAVSDMLAAARKTLAEIEKCVENIEQLAMQRAALKPTAWGR
jgi:hypothetical protein